MLLVEGESISLERGVRYLERAGKLAAVLGEILRRYVLERELARREDLVIHPVLVDVAVEDFCSQNLLADRDQLADWLTLRGQDPEAFTAEILDELRIEKLKLRVTESDLESYFGERKRFLDRVVLSRIVVRDRDQAHELRAQCERGASFGELARRYSESEEHRAHGALGAVAIMDLPAELRQRAGSVPEGEIVGPFELRDVWALYRIEEHRPAEYEDEELRRALRDELFERWIAQQIEDLKVELEL